MLTTQQVADRYVELAQQSKRPQIIEELYGDDIVAREPAHAAALGIPTLTEGLVAVKAKLEARHKLIDAVHSESCSAPVVGGTYFSVALGRDITLKGRRVQLSEIAVFEVKAGKIVAETFYF